QEDLRSLGDRLRGDAAEDEPPSVPVEMVLGEVALKDAAPHARGPHVAPRAGTLARELEVYGARGEHCLAPRLPPVGAAGPPPAPGGRPGETPCTRAPPGVSRTTRPSPSSSGRRRPWMRLAEPTKSATKALRGRS